MKKNFLLSAVLVVIFNSGISASNASLFQFDEKMLSRSMEDLNKLENFVSLHKDITFSQLQRSHTILTKDMHSGINMKSLLGIAGVTEFNWGTFMGGVAAGAGLCILGCVVVIFAEYSAFMSAFGGGL